LVYRSVRPDYCSVRLVYRFDFSGFVNPADIYIYMICHLPPERLMSEMVATLIAAVVVCRTDHESKRGR
jgi:hypothetical protein